MATTNTTRNINNAHLQAEYYNRGKESARKWKQTHTRKQCRLVRQYLKQQVWSMWSHDNHLRVAYLNGIIAELPYKENLWTQKRRKLEESGTT